MWIYEHESWPNFKWNVGELSALLADVRHRQGRLLGRMDALGFDLQREASLNMLTSDVVKSSAIEGEVLQPQEVRSSIARQLGMDVAGLVPSSRDVDGIVEMMLDATQHFDRPLTKERLFNWHAALFPTGRSGMHSITVGAWRTAESGPMRVVSGPVGHEMIHFEAPHANQVDAEMNSFLDRFDLPSKVDPVLKAGVAHLWFVTIHPFEDGNGRIARAISDLAMTRADGLADRFYSLSTQIESEKDDYYYKLERQQRGTPDITEWLHWFLACLGRAIASAEDTLANVLQSAKQWDAINRHPINERQRRVLTRMLDADFQGHINTSKFAKLAKCSNDTALRDIQQLKSWDILVQNEGGGRSTSYRLSGNGENTSD